MSQSMLMWKIFQHKNHWEKTCKTKQGWMPGIYLMEISMSLQSYEKMNDFGFYCIIYHSFLSMIPDYLLLKMEPTFNLNNIMLAFFSLVSIHFN